MPGDPHPIDDIVVDGSDVQKIEFRSYVKEHTRVQFATADEVRALNLSGQLGGIEIDGDDFNLDPDDTTTADDDDTCIVDADGNRFKIKIPRYIEVHANPVNVGDYGAFPDGSDYGDEIDEALAAAEARGGGVVFEATGATDKYVTSKVHTLTHGMKVQSLGGPGATRIAYLGAGCFKVPTRRITIDGFTFLGDDAVGATPTAVLLACSVALIDECLFSNLKFESTLYDFRAEEDLNPAGSKMDTLTFFNIVSQSRKNGGRSLDLRNLAGSIELIIYRALQNSVTSGENIAINIEGAGGVVMRSVTGIGGFNHAANASQHFMRLLDCSSVTADFINGENFGGKTMLLDGTNFCQFDKVHVGVGDGIGIEVIAGEQVDFGKVRVRGNRGETAVGAPTPALDIPGMVFRDGSKHCSVDSLRVWETTGDAAQVLDTTCQNIEFKSITPYARAGGVNIGGHGLYNEGTGTRVKHGHFAGIDGHCIKTVSGWLEVEDVTLAGTGDGLYDLGVAKDRLINWRDSAGNFTALTAGIAAG